MACMVLPGPALLFWSHPQLNSLLLSMLKPYGPSLGYTNGLVCILHGALHMPFPSAPVSSSLFDGSQPCMHYRIMWDAGDGIPKSQCLGLRLIFKFHWSA